LACVDHFSRFVVLAPLKTKQAEEVAHSLVQNLFMIFDTPRTLISDNGGEFINAILSEVCKIFKVNKINVTPYHPQSNGLVERCNRKILEILRHVVAQPLKDTWEDWLAFVAASINGSINSSTDKSPHYIIFGKDKTLPYDILLAEDSPCYNIDNYAIKQSQVFRAIHKVVRENLQASRLEMIAKQHMTAKDRRFAIGDKVMIKTPERHSKLDPKFKGPYIITSLEQCNKVKIKCVTSSAESVVHVDRLKLISGPEPKKVTHKYFLRSANKK
jgi:hypothetical protein